MINVLIVDDSAVTSSYLRFILSQDSEINVIATATDGKQGVEFAQQYHPDVITMDLHMPRMDGYEATKEIMATAPTPIVIVSASYDTAQVQKTFKAIEVGAVAVMEKPRGLTSPDHRQMAQELIRLVKQAAHTRVHRHSNGISASVAARPKPRNHSALPGDIRYVAIGSSTGGPLVLQKILAALPADFPVPIFVVQHIAKGFTQGMVDWIAGSCALKIKMADHGERPVPGVVYIAPDAKHMKLTRGGTLALTDDLPEHSVRPSVSYFFRSLIEAGLARYTLALLLTGMGKDGSAELKQLKDAGATTIAQDEKSSVVFGMPGEAVKLGGTTYILNPEEIIVKLRELLLQK